MWFSFQESSKLIFTMKIPIEFSPDFIDAKSPKEKQLYRCFLKSDEPFHSIMKKSLVDAAESAKKPLEWGIDRY